MFTSGSTPNTDESVSCWTAQYAAARRINRAKHPAIERALYEVVDACASVAASEPRNQRRAAVQSYLRQLNLQRQRRHRLADAWRIDLLDWIATQDSFLQHMTK